MGHGLKIIFSISTICLLVSVWGAFGAKTANAHKSHAHPKKSVVAKEQDQKPTASDAEKTKIQNQEINDLYLKEVKGIFETKCFNCHSTKTKYPWYFSLPLVKGMIQEDIREAMEHLDMTGDFPFKGHGTPAEDLEGLKGVTEENSMPPTKYKIMHWNHWVTDEDRKSIIDWINQSKDILEAGHSE